MSLSSSLTRASVVVTIPRARAHIISVNSNTNDTLAHILLYSNPCSIVALSVAHSLVQTQIEMHVVHIVYEMVWNPWLFWWLWLVWFYGFTCSAFSYSFYLYHKCKYLCIRQTLPHISFLSFRVSGESILVSWLCISVIVTTERATMFSA